MPTSSLNLHQTDILWPLTWVWNDHDAVCVLDENNTIDFSIKRIEQNTRGLAFVLNAELNGAVYDYVLVLTRAEWAAHSRLPDYIFDGLLNGDITGETSQLMLSTIFSNLLGLNIETKQQLIAFAAENLN